MHFEILLGHALYQSKKKGHKFIYSYTTESKLKILGQQLLCFTVFIHYLRWTRNKLFYVLQIEMRFWMHFEILLGHHRALYQSKKKGFYE